MNYPVGTLNASVDNMGSTLRKNAQAQGERGWQTCVLFGLVSKAVPQTTSLQCPKNSYISYNRHRPQKEARSIC